MKKILFDDTELEYDIFQSKNKKFVNSMNSINENIILIHGGIMADANIPLVTFSDIFTKNYNILHYHRRDMVKVLTKEIILQVYFSM